MLITKTPFRISLVGGGTDLKNFYKNESGCVISTTINKYIYLSMHEYFHQGRYLLKYSKTENIGSITEIKHKIIKEVFRIFDIKNVDFNSTADIPSGTGMGSSSAFTCGLINLCSNYNGISLPNYEIARLACEIEIDILNEPIGKQDQYGCAIGGLKLIKFNTDDSVEIKPIFLQQEKLKKLEDNLLLFYTNITREASTILKEQEINTTSNLTTKDNLKSMSKLTLELYNDLQSNNIESIGYYLNESWLKKRELASKITNPELDFIYKKAIENGALGGKLLGAGGGGFFLFYVEKENQSKLRSALTQYNYNELSFSFDFNGTELIFNK